MSLIKIIIFFLTVLALTDLAIYLFVPRLRKAAAIFARISIGLVFVFSGFVKAVDPLGSAYKIHDYLSAFGLNWLLPSSLTLGTLLNLAEFLIGFVVLFGVRMKLFSWGTLLFMILFTPLTFYLALTNPVTDCGCFGDFLVMTNWETFFKNLVFFTSAIIVFSYRKKFNDTMFSIWFKNGIIALGIIIAMGMQFYAIRYDALIDFRPWKVGNRIADQMVSTPEKADVYLVYKNTETGKEEEYTNATLPWQDSVKMSKIEFINQRKVVIEPFVEAPIHDITISNSQGDDLTDSILNKTDYHFILIAYDLEKTNIESFTIINAYAKKCIDENIPFIGLTGSSNDDMNSFSSLIKPIFPFYYADGTALKTIIRTNPGILLLKDGYIIDKWPFRSLPSFEKYKASIKKYDVDYMKYKTRPIKIETSKP